MMLKNLNVLITGVQLAEKLKEYFDKHGLYCVEIPNCVGYSQKFSFMEYIGLTEVKKSILLFKTKDLQSESIVKFILTFFNEKNNGVMFTIKGDSKVTEENVLYVAIVNSGKAENVARCIRKSALVGSTVIEGNGNGGTQEELFGVGINSAKEIVLSVMPQTRLNAVKKAVKEAFDDENSDVVSFVLPVCDFNKLHQG